MSLRESSAIDPRKQSRTLARNQSLFREVNEQIKRLSVRHSLVDVDMICECSDPGCSEMLSVPLDEYELVRGVSTRFLVLPGHEIPEIERTVGEYNGFIVVEKIGDDARVAARLDPRASRERDSGS